MSNEQVRRPLQLIRRLMAALQNQDAIVCQEIEAAIEELHLIYEEMQTSLDAAEVITEELFGQNQRLTAEYYHYYNLFHGLPIAYLVIDPNGLIVEANQACSQLLNVPQQYLSGKPLAVYIAERERLHFRTTLNQFSQNQGKQVLPINLCPRNGQPFSAQLHIAIACSSNGLIKTLGVGVYELSQFPERVTQLSPESNSEQSQTQELMPVSQLPQSLDGLRVLIVDDEPNVREFITAVLQLSGISVKAVSSLAQALEEIDAFHPDVLLSDIRMPGGDGYSLIRQIRAKEATEGAHIRAAAITAYLEEDREKALSAGFEAYLHKLAPPNEWVEMVTQLAGRSSK